MSTALVWFRRDLRVYDHAALHHALNAHGCVHCVFVFDTTILDQLPRRDRRVDFILRAVEELAAALQDMGGAPIICHGNPLDEVPRLAAELDVASVYVNRDYEPAACPAPRRCSAISSSASTAMRQLSVSGYMHNRLRMVAASFLTKDLGLDWRQGDAWFAGKLLDFDPATNNGGWQWAASTG